MFTLNCKGRLLTITEPIVMGIINTTPDSFYAASRKETTEVILRQAEQMISEGAVILDLGGQSTRPGSQRVEAEEEIKRVIPAISAIHERFPETVLSCDTFYSRVAAAALDAGAGIINDISAGQLDPEMFSKVAEKQVPYVLMHMKGNPQTMQQQTHYQDLTREVFDFLLEKTEAARKAGIKDIIIDPGFGFAKTIEQNFRLLQDLSVFTTIGAPLLLGISRKSFIWKTLGQTPDTALEGTIALQMAGLMKGANIIRAHDVKAARQVIRLYQSMMK